MNARISSPNARISFRKGRPTSERACLSARKARTSQARIARALAEVLRGDAALVACVSTYRCGSEAGDLRWQDETFLRVEDATHRRWESLVLLFTKPAADDSNEDEVKSEDEDDDEEEEEEDVRAEVRLTTLVRKQCLVPY